MAGLGEEAPLSHEEIWDDSALVTSWNEAYEEYQKYHSLAAKGQKASPQPTRAETAEAKSKAVANGAPSAQPASFAPVNFAGPRIPQTHAGASVDSYRPGVTDSYRPTPPASGVASTPQALLAGTQDETMKNLMMSWYYAGYYTGLLEGKQQAFASLQESSE